MKLCVSIHGYGFSLVMSADWIVSSQKGYIINASGKHGDDAKNGQPPTSVTTSSSSLNSMISLNQQKNGLDASTPTPGEHGKQVTLNLQIPSGSSSSISLPTSASSFAVQVKCIILDSGLNGTEISEIWHLNPSQFISILADGGNGGRGGYGSDGVDGDMGIKGTDATQDLNSTRGGRGGDGGDAGRGTSGANAGNGGRVFVQVHERYANLLMLLGNIFYNPGKPGAPGMHGKPGRGGPGGPGGNEYRPLQQNETITLDNKLVFRERGKKGPPGLDGKAHNDALTWGRPGNLGLFRIIVFDDQNQSKEYSGIYDLEFISCKIASLRNQSPLHFEDDGIWEPGERVAIYEIVVRNRGKMPTPRFSDIFIEIEPSDNIVLLDSSFSSVKCPYAIPVGDSVTLEGQIIFEISSVITFQSMSLPNFQKNSSSKVLLNEDSINNCQLPSHESSLSKCKFTLPIVLKALVAEVERYFDNFSSFPSLFLDIGEVAEFDANQMPASSSFYVGEWQEYVIYVKNNSLFGLGTYSSTHRSIKVEITYVEGRIPVHCIFIRTDPFSLNGTSLNQDTFFDIPLLAASTGENENCVEKIVFWVKIENVPSYIECKLNFRLLIQPLQQADSDSFRLLEAFSFVMHSSQRYSKSANSTYLLVTSKDNSYEEISSWCKLTSIYGQYPDIWDLDQEGHFSLSKNIPNFNISLGEQWSGSFIIILCSSVRLVSSYFDRNEFLFWRKKINFYFFAVTEYDFSWLIYWTFPFNYSVKEHIKKEEIFKEMQNFASSSKDQIENHISIQSKQHSLEQYCGFEMDFHTGCFACFKASNEIVLTLHDYIEKSFCKNEILANFKYLLVHHQVKKTIKVDFIPFKYNSKSKGSGFSWCSCLEGIFDIKNIYHTLFLIPFDSRISTFRSNIKDWSADKFTRYSEYLLKSITVDIIYECNFIYKSISGASVDKPQEWLDKLEFLNSFIDLDSVINTLYYEKNAFWDELSDSILYILIGVKFISTFHCERIALNKSHCNLYYQNIEAKILARLGQFICPYMKESTKDYTINFIDKTLKSQFAHFPEDSNPLDYFCQKYICKESISTVKDGYESGLWVRSKDIIVDYDLFLQLKDKFS